jgi:hypothetical protein
MVIFSKRIFLLIHGNKKGFVLSKLILNEVLNHKFLNPTQATIKVVTPYYGEKLRGAEKLSRVFLSKSFLPRRCLTAQT